MNKPEIRILLAEDDQADSLLVRRLLEAASDVRLSIEVLATAAEATERLEHGGVDLVLLDLRLPDSLGFDTVLHFRMRFPGLPMVVLTGVDDEDVGLQAVECGAQDYVSKDQVTGHLLLRAVRCAIARHGQIASYKAQAHADPLTGLPNRRAFDAELDRAISEFERNGRQFSLVLFDVDHFKRVNDQHGHRTGDFVLCRVASVLSAQLRRVDFAGRFGGEEFAAVLGHSEKNGAINATERVLNGVAATEIEFEGKVLQVTLSAGIARCYDGDNAATIIERADAALYQAKRSGRNHARQGEAGVTVVRS